MDESNAPTIPTEAAVHPPNSEYASPVMTTERLSAAFASLQAELEALHASTAHEENRGEELDARDAHLREHAAQLSEREFHLAERHRELNAAQEQLLTDASTWRQREAGILAREQALAQREAMAANPAPVTNDQHIITRRARLKRQRALLAERAMQLIRAKEAIARRFADTARTRTSLPLAGQPVPAAAATSTTPPLRRSSFASFGAGMFAVSLALAAIAGTSWWAAGLIDQPRFAAQTTIGMETQAAPIDADAAESWASFHQELAKDPQLLEQAADRLRRRGYDDLSTPSDLRRYLDEYLTIDSGTLGRLNLSILGDGRLRTQRILESYTAVLVGMSNDSRERRADRSSTAVLIDARSGDEPVSDHRLPIFAWVAGGLTLLCGIAGPTGVSIATRARPIKNNSAVENDGGEEDVWAIR